MTSPFTALGRLTRALVALVFLIVLVGGVPTLLVVTVGWPLPDHWPTGVEWQFAVTNPMDDQRLLNTLAIITWIAWLHVLRDITIEVLLTAADISAARAGRPRAPRAPGGGPGRLVAGVLIGAVTAVIVANLARATLARAPSSTNDQPYSGGPDLAVTAPHQTGATEPPPVDTDPAPAVAAYTTGGGGSARTALNVPARPAILTAYPTHSDAMGAWARAAPGRCHRVTAGDNLWNIATNELGDPHRWREIYVLNRDKPQPNGYTLRDPDEIHIGWLLALPTRSTNGTPTAPPKPAGAHPKPPTPTLPTVAPATSAPPTVAPTPVASSPTLAPSDTQEPESDQAPIAADHRFIDIAGGSITAGLAAGLLVAAAMVWRRRRHRYQPTPIDAVDLDDPDLAPPLAATAYLRRTLRRDQPDLLNPTDPGPTVREYNAAAIKPPLPPTGPTGTDLAGVGHLPASAGVGLQGPGGLDAARGILVASLTAGTPDDPEAQDQVVISAAALATILGVSAVDLPPMQRLTITATINDAITHIEEEIIRRTRILADHDANDLTELRAHHPLAQPIPALLLICDVPEPPQQQRLASVLHLGANLAIRAALTGLWDRGVTLTVAADGATTGEATTTRVTVLDTEATIAILTMLAESHGDSTSHAITDTRQPPDAPAGSPEAQPDAEPPGPSDEADSSQPADGAGQPDARVTQDKRTEKVRVRVLGTPMVLDTHGQPMEGLRGKGLELLVILALNRNGIALIDIMEALWPEATVKRAAERLSTVTANLRNALRAAHPNAPAAAGAAAAANTETPSGVAGSKRKPKASEPIPNTGSRYHLDPALAQVDWWTVLDEYALVATDEDDDSRRRHLLAAIAEIRGPLAQGQKYDWIETDREHVRRRSIKLHAHAAQILHDDPVLARLLHDSASDADPMSEELARRAMKAAADVGDADSIRRRLDTLRDALQADHLEVDDTTVQFADDLLRSLTQPGRADQ